jgi:uncharacterized protein (TIRG00374 family)
MDEKTPPPPRSQPGLGEGRRLGRNIAFAVVAGLTINVLLGLFVDFATFKTTLLKARAWEVLLPFAAILIVYLIDSLRYILIFGHFGLRLSFLDAFYNNVLGYFFCNITPSSAGGQPFQIYHFSRLGIDSKTATNVIFSRLMIANFSQLLIVLVFLKKGLALLAAAGNGAYVLGAGMATTILLSLLLLLVFWKPTLIGHLALGVQKGRLGAFIGKLTRRGDWAQALAAWSLGLRDSFRFLWAQKSLAILLDTALFLLVQVIWSLGLYLPLLAISGSRLPFDDFLFAFIVCGLVSAYVPTPGASGSVEAAYALVLGDMTGGFGPALSAVFLWRLGSYYLHLPFGALLLALNRRRSAGLPST